MLKVPFVYSSNGDGFLEHDRITGKERQIDLEEFPSPEQLWNRYKQHNNIDNHTIDNLTELGKEKSRLIYEGELLLTNSGATLGVPKISKITGCINDGVALLRNFHKYDMSKYMYYYLTSQTPIFRSIDQGMGQPNLNTAILSGWYVPISELSASVRFLISSRRLRVYKFSVKFARYCLSFI